MRGIADGYYSHMLDVIRICAKSWEYVTFQHIDWCWKSSGILSASHVAGLTPVSYTHLTLPTIYSV